MSALDTNLIQVYKNMVGLGNIQNISGNSTFQGGVSINSNLYVSNTSIFNNSATITGSLYVSGQTIINNATSINSSLFISGLTIINGTTSILSNLNISGSTFINGSLNVSGASILLNGATTIGSSLNVSGTATFQNSIITSQINAVNNILNINSPNITIGNSNSNVYINGTATYIATTNLQIIDKLINLNLNSNTFAGADIGNNSGIQILGTSGNGYIQTDPYALSYQIKAPANPNSGYIVIQDSNNNIYITGTTTLMGNTTIGSNLNISGTSIFNNSVSINSSLNVSGNTIINGLLTINSSLNISGNTSINGSATILNSLNVSGITNLQGSTSILSSLNVSGYTIINGNFSIISGLNVSGNTNIMGSQTIVGSLYVSNTTILQSTTILSSLYVSGNTILNNSLTIGSNLNVSGITTINSATTINSSLNVSGMANIYGNTTLMSTLNILGQIIASLPNYSTNSAALAGGIPYWGFYRTGGILKIALNATPPTIQLNGLSSITTSSGLLSYYDPGVIGQENSGPSLLGYLISISSNTTINIITNQILLSGPSTLITSNSLLVTGTYQITYQVTDNEGNSSTINRVLQVF